MRYPRSALSFSQENTNGLIIWWTFDDGSAQDISGSGDPGTLTNSPVVVDGFVRARGVPGNALQFNGTNNYVVNKAVVNIPNVTMSIWVKINGNPALVGQISSFVNGLGAAQSDKNLAVTATGLARWFVWDNVAGGTVTSTAAVTDNQWHHIVGTHDSTTARLYVDGVSVGTPAAAGASDTTYTVPNIFVSGNETGGLPTVFMAFTGDDFRVYNRAMSADEVNALYNRGIVSNVDEWEMPSLFPLTKYAAFSTPQHSGRTTRPMVGY